MNHTETEFNSNLYDKVAKFTPKKACSSSSFFLSLQLHLRAQFMFFNNKESS